MILLFGDVHGNFDRAIKLVKTHKPAAVIFLGDLEPQQPFEKVVKDILGLTEVYFIHGNHDTDTDANYKNLFLSGLADRNIHGRVVDIDGLKVAGLGGIFREPWMPVHDINVEPKYQNYEQMIDAMNMRQYMKARAHNKANEVPDGNARKHVSSIFYDDWLNLSVQKADILVTHEAPSCHKYGFVAIDELARSMHVKKAFHGHHHDRLDYSSQFNTLGFEAFGVGFCGVCNQDGKLIAKGDFDDARAFRQKK